MATPRPSFCISCGLLVCIILFAEAKSANSRAFCSIIYCSAQQYVFPSILKYAYTSCSYNRFLLQVCETHELEHYEPPICQKSLPKLYGFIEQLTRHSLHRKRKCKYSGFKLSLHKAKTARTSMRYYALKMKGGEIYDQSYSVRQSERRSSKDNDSYCLLPNPLLLMERWLLFDLDPQENASNTLRLKQDVPNLWTFMTSKDGEADVFTTCLQSVEGCKNITAIRGDIQLSAADLLFNRQGREFIIKERLEAHKADQDVVIMDTPPALGVLTVNALTSANTVVVPISPDGYSLQGFYQLNENIRLIKVFKSAAQNRRHSCHPLCSQHDCEQRNQGNRIGVCGNGWHESV